MRKTTCCIIVLLIGIMPLTMAYAQREAGTLTVGGFGGMGMPMGGEFFKDYYGMGIGFGGMFQYNLSEMNSLVGSFTLQSFKVDADAFTDLMAGMIPVAGATVEMEGGNVKTTIISANFVRYLSQPDASMQLYFTAGGGYYSFKPEDMTVKITVPGQVIPDETIEGEDAETGFGINGGLGFEIKMGPKLSLFAEGKYHYTFVEIEGVEALQTEDEKISFITAMGGIRIGL